MKENMWNPWHGCHKYSEGCLNCYMFFFDKERDIDSNIVHKTKDFNLPIQKDRNGRYKIEDGQEISTCLTSDFFIEEADPWRDDAWKIIKARPNVHFDLFTKRVKRIQDCLPADWGNGYDNVSITLTAENQRCVNERLPIFIDLPIKHRVVTVSPILEDVDISPYLRTGKIEEVFCSGENYRNARVCRYAWVKNLSEQCKKFQTKFVFFSTGAKFEKDGVIYNIPHKLSKEQARRANLDNMV